MEPTVQGVLAVKICKYLRAAAIRHTAVVRAFRAHSANKTFYTEEKRRERERGTTRKREMNRFNSQHD